MAISAVHESAWGVIFAPNVGEVRVGLEEFRITPPSLGGGDVFFRFEAEGRVTHIGAGYSAPAAALALLRGVPLQRALDAALPALTEAKKLALAVLRDEEDAVPPLLDEALARWGRPADFVPRARLEEDREALLRHLQALEWADWDQDCMCPCCRECGALKSTKTHDANCRLGELLGRLTPRAAPGASAAP